MISRKMRSIGVSRGGRGIQPSQDDRDIVRLRVTRHKRSFRLNFREESSAVSTVLLHEFLSRRTASRLPNMSEFNPDKCAEQLIRAVLIFDEFGSHSISAPSEPRCAGQSLNTSDNARRLWLRRSDRAPIVSVCS